MDVGLLILRLVVGAYLFGHGAQKLFGWFGGGGLKGTRGMIVRLGFRPAPFWALMSGLGEAGGGLLLGLGLLSPLGSFGIGAVMIVAIVMVHWSKGIWNVKGGFELPLTNLVTAVAVGFTGPGRYSLDRLTGISLPEPLVAIGLTALVGAALLAGFFTREAAPARPQQSSAA